MISRLPQAFKYPLSTLPRATLRSPCKTRFRLAGSAFCREGVGPSGRTTLKVSDCIQPRPTNSPMPGSSGLVMSRTGPAAEIVRQARAQNEHCRVTQTVCSAMVHASGKLTVARSAALAPGRRATYLSGGSGRLRVICIAWTASDCWRSNVWPTSSRHLIDYCGPAIDLFLAGLPTIRKEGASRSADRQSRGRSLSPGSAGQPTGC